jgi:parallel beta-helix repeat protein
MITKIALARAALLLLGIGATPPAAYGFNYTLNTIKTCGGVIPSGATGTWTVINNLMTTSPSVNCITIQASGVAIDLRGHTITAAGRGLSESWFGITDGGSCTPSCQQNIIIANGTIKGFSQGIALTGTEHATIANMDVPENIYGINVEQNYAAVSDSRANNNMAVGVTFGGSNDMISNSAANNNGDVGIVFAGSNNTVNNSLANGNGNSGMAFFNTNIGANTNNSVNHSQANGNKNVGLFFEGADNKITDSQANGNGNGISIAESGNILTGNTANGNGSVGIDVVCPSDLFGNSAAGNTPNTPAGNIMTSGTGCARLGNQPAP